MVGWNNTDVTSAKPSDLSRPVHHSRSQRNDTTALVPSRRKCDRSTKAVAFSCAEESIWPIASNDCARWHATTNYTIRNRRRTSARQETSGSDKPGKLERSKSLSGFHNNSANKPELPPKSILSQFGQNYDIKKAGNKYSIERSLQLRCIIERRYSLCSFSTFEAG